MKRKIYWHDNTTDLIDFFKRGVLCQCGHRFLHHTITQRSTSMYAIFTCDHDGCPDDMEHMEIPTNLQFIELVNKLKNR